MDIMATIKVKALYDFDGEPGSAELSIRVGEILVITRRDVGSGWMEGENSTGQVGLFPEAYVEAVTSGGGPPSMPPPQLPPIYTEVPGGDWPGQDNWNQNQDTGSQQAQATEEFWDDDWDEDSEGGQSGPVTVGSAPQDFRQDTQSIHSNFSRGAIDSKAPVKKNFNRFSAFVKTGGEDYIIGKLKIAVQDVDKFYIVESSEGVVWDPITDPYICAIASPKKESKLKGLKSFIAYQLTPSFNNIQVSRRYKHFDWLHERLEEKFSLIPIPPLPDKQISGRYEEQFIEHRRVQLQLFVDCVCKHPVLSRCAVWQHFMTCTDEKRWKQGKRRAEKDELVGANYFACLQAPDRPLDIPELESQAENASKFVHSMDNAVKNLISTASDQTKKHQTLYKREYQRIGQAFTFLGNSFETDDSAEHLTRAIKDTGEAYNNIGRLFEDQPKADWEPLGDQLHIYKGTLTSFPDILNVHKAALQKYKEVSNDNRVDAGNIHEMKRRTDTMSYALLSEISHFHSQRAVDFKITMKNFLTEQISLHQKVISELQGALSNFED